MIKIEDFFTTSPTAGFMGGIVNISWEELMAGEIDLEEFEYQPETMIAGRTVVSYFSDGTIVNHDNGNVLASIEEGETVNGCLTELPIIITD